MLNIEHLYCEYLTAPIAMDTPCPRLSWTVANTERAILQSQYRVIACSSQGQALRGEGDFWDTGWISSGESANIPYKRKTLQSDTKYWWSVKIRDDRGNESPFAVPDYFITALFHQRDWKACWIGPKSPRTSITGYQYSEIRSPYLRKEVFLPRKVSSARAYFSGLGWGELHINGKKVGNSVLDPAPTDYDKSILYRTHDVSEFLNEGTNAIGIVLGNGWFSEYMWKEAYGAAPKAMLQMSVQFEDGRTEVITTDKNWKTSFGPILETRMWGGEVYDARLELDGWDCAGYDDSNWTPVTVKDRSRGIMKSQSMPPVKVMEDVVPLALPSRKKDVLVYDMGKLFGGWSKIRFVGNAGASVSVRYSDRIFPDGEIDQHDQVSVPNLAGRIEMWKPSTDVYILRGYEGGETYEPHFTYHPVQYVQVEFDPREVSLLDITGRRVYADIDLSGRFTCDNGLLNRIHDAVVLTLTNQMFGIPLDCLYREHWGWIDPGSLAGTLYTRQYMPAYWIKWLEDIRESQFANGAIPDIAPNYIQWDNVDPIWGGSYPRLVWFLYLYYHDAPLLAGHYESMKRSYEYHCLHAIDGILTEGSYGDHMLPGEEAGQEQFISQETSPAFLWTGCHYETALILSRSAEVLGKTEEILYYAKLAQETKKAINDKWFDVQNASYDMGSQTSLFYALAADIVPKGHERRVLARAAADLELKYHGSHHTGNTGTTAMIDVLGDMGRQDLMYGIASKTTYPGWGYMMANGSSTIWESWSQESASGCSELSMTLWATIDEFFFNDIAGIKGPDFFRQGDFAQAGFKQIVVAPYLPHDMKKAFGSFRTVYGTISSGWEKHDGKTVFNISIPVNTAATVLLPAGPGCTLMESSMVVWQDGMSRMEGNNGMAGRNDAAVDEDDAIADNRIGMHDDIRTGIFACGFKENRLEIRIGSGNYCFHLTEV